MASTAMIAMFQEQPSASSLGLYASNCKTSQHKISWSPKAVHITLGLYRRLDRTSAERLLNSRAIWTHISKPISDGFDISWDQGPILLIWINWILAWIINHMPSKVWYQIIYQFPIWNGGSVGFWECISNLIPYNMMGVITYPWLIVVGVQRPSKGMPAIDWNSVLP